MADWELIHRSGDEIGMLDGVTRRVVCEQFTTHRDHPAVVYQEAVKFSPAPGAQYQPAMILLVRLRRRGREWEMKILDRTRVRAMTAKR